MEQLLGILFLEWQEAAHNFKKEQDQYYNSNGGYAGPPGSYYSAEIDLKQAEMRMIQKFKELLLGH